MSKKTTNYELIKPELTDAADITAMNQNWDKIDTELAKTTPIAQGGTGATDAVNARKNLGIGNVATENVLPIAKGGTGATAVNDVKRNLGIPLSLTCGNTSKDDVDGEGWFKVFEIPHSGWVSYQLNMVIETANTFNLHTWTDNDGKKHHALPVEFQLILRAEDNPMDSVLDRKMPPTVYITGGNPTILNYFYIVQDTENATSGSYELWYKNPTAFALANVFVQNISSRNKNVDFNVIKIGDVNTAKPTYTAGKTAYCLYNHYSLNFPTIPIDKGGTGATNVATARQNLGLGTVATENVVPIGKGGTGATTEAGARQNLGLGNVATENVVPIEKGGTGATDVDNALTNLGVFKSKAVYFANKQTVLNVDTKICEMPTGAKLSDVKAFAFKVDSDDQGHEKKEFYGAVMMDSPGAQTQYISCNYVTGEGDYSNAIGKVGVTLSVKDDGCLYCKLGYFYGYYFKDGEATYASGLKILEYKYWRNAIVYF